MGRKRYLLLSLLCIDMWMHNATEGAWNIVWGCTKSFLLPGRGWSFWCIPLIDKPGDLPGLEFIKLQRQSPCDEDGWNRGISTHNALGKGPNECQECWLADFSSRTACCCLVQLILVQSIEIIDFRELRENLANQNKNARTKKYKKTAMCLRQMLKFPLYLSIRDYSQDILYMLLG